MQIALREATLAQLDGLQADALALFVDAEQRPLQGLAGLCDWRLCGQLSRVLAAGFFAGHRGEALLMPVGQRLRVARLLVFGLGRERDLAGALAQALEAAPKAGVRSLALALPDGPALPALPEGEGRPALSDEPAPLDVAVALWARAARSANLERQILFGALRPLSKAVRAAIAGEPTLVLDGETDGPPTRRS